MKLQGRSALIAGFILLFVLVAGTGVFGQRRSTETAPDPEQNNSKFIKERGPDRRKGVPEWEREKLFAGDTFTFVRLRYQNSGREFYGRGGWRTDYPGADLNFSYRLAQLTSMKVDPQGLVIDIDDPQLTQFPFVFMSDPRSLYLSDHEAEILRKYLLNGGFLMVDDFWGDRMMKHLLEEMKKVFPDRQLTSLPTTHPILNTPFKLDEMPQIPSEDSALRQKYKKGLERTWEDEIDDENPQPAALKAFLDDKGRVMMLICWNTDLGDGWEEEGISEWFFETYSEKSAYPLGINIVFYALTH